MTKVLELLKSRKFWAAVGSIVGLIVTGIQGIQPWTFVAVEVVGIVMAWITGQSLVDAAKD